MKVVSDTRVVAEATKSSAARCRRLPVRAAELSRQEPGHRAALTNAIVRADKWIQAAGAGDIIKAVPESYLLGDRAVYVDAFLAAKGALSADGSFPEAGAETARRAAREHRPGDRRCEDRPRPRSTPTSS